METLLENRKGLAPLPGRLLMFFIFFLIFVLSASVLSEDGGMYRDVPFMILEVNAVNNSALKIQHLGGDALDLDPSKTLITLSVGSKEHRLETFGLKSFEVGDTGFLSFKSEGGEPIIIVPGSITTLKIVDLESRRLIFVQKVYFMKGADTREEKPYLSGLFFERQYVMGP